MYSSCRSDSNHSLVQFNSATKCLTFVYLKLKRDLKKAFITCLHTTRLVLITLVPQANHYLKILSKNVFFLLKMQERTSGVPFELIV